MFGVYLDAPVGLVSRVRKICFGDVTGTTGRGFSGDLIKFKRLGLGTLQQTMAVCGLGLSGFKGDWGSPVFSYQAAQGFSRFCKFRIGSCQTRQFVVSWG